MHIERLDQGHLYPLGEHPGDTSSLPSPGIEPGSHASQAGTLPKELSRQLIHWLFGTSSWPGGERPPMLYMAVPVHEYMLYTWT